jgi:hypothetical protein
MTLPSAPSAISFNDISLELFCSITTYNLNDGYGRCITCLPTPCSTISLSNFYGKTAPLSTLATCACGGWYMGCTCACGTNYYLIVAPATPGFQYDYYRSGTPSVCQNLPIFSPGPIGCNPVASYDGYCSTKFIQACPGYNPLAPAASAYTYPLFNKINALSINGYSDWYIPAATDILTVFCNMDYAWKCGGPMKTSGNQFPTCINQVVPAPAAGSPGCWPYLGYTSGCIAPGASGFGTGWNCNNGGWPATGSTQFQQYPVCTSQPMSSSYVSTTQGSGQPTGLMPTACGATYVSLAPRFWCSGNAPCGQGGGWPTPPAWCSGQRCALYMTRAVRRVAI